MARPPRNAAKAASAKIKAAKQIDKSQRSDGVENEQNSDNDSDEYQEPARDESDHNDDNEDVDDDTDPDLDNKDVDNEADYPSDDSVKSKPKKKRKPPLRPPGMDYQLSGRDVDRFLSVSYAEDSQAGMGLPAIDGVEIITTTLKDKMAPQNAPKPRPPRQYKPRKGTVHKKGELNTASNVPKSWKDAHQGPTSNDLVSISMQEPLLRRPIYENVTCNTEHFKIVTAQSDLDEYLPTPTTTQAYVRQKTVDISPLDAGYVETTEKPGINDFYMLNTGVSVWSLDWCPLPSNVSSATTTSDNRDYVAIGGFPDTDESCQHRDQLYYLGKQDPHPNLIQIWSLNCNTNQEGELQGKPDAHLALCILHSYGAVFDLKWCPYGNWMEAGQEPGDLPRLGILAATFSDGTIRIFSIPDPSSLIKGRKTESSSSEKPDVVYIRYREPFATLRLGDICCMSVSWGSAERLAAAGTNGTVYVWDMKELLSQSQETLAEKDSEYLDPIYAPQVHDVSIRTVDWMRYNDAQIVPWIVVSCSYDGRTRYTDVRDMHAPLDIRSFLGVPMATMSIPWAEGTAYVDLEYGLKFDQLYRESPSFRLFNAKGVIWDMSYSNFQPFTAAAVSDGRVLLTNPAYKARRGYGMVQNHLYQFETVEVDQSNNSTSKGIASSGDSNLMLNQGQSNNRQSFRYQEEEAQEYLSKAFASILFFPPNVAIQKVQWSTCFHSAAWLASGSASGVVRIDNTMLRRREGGGNNKLEYEVEAYILKKREANGGEPKKLGRPRKHPLKGDRTTKRSAGSKRGSARKRVSSYEEDGVEDDDDNVDDDEDDHSDEAERSEGTVDEGSHVLQVNTSANSERAPPRPSTRSLSRLTSNDPDKTLARQSTKLAPLFTRAKSSSSLTGTGVTSSTAEKDVHSAMNTTKKTAQEDALIATSTTPRAQNNPSLDHSKRRGRPPKTQTPSDKSTKGQTLLHMMRSAAIQDGGSQVGTTDVEMGDALPAHNRAFASDQTGTIAAEGGESNSALSGDHTSAGAQTESVLGGMASSLRTSRSSSLARDSKRATNNAKKQKELPGKKNQSLKDLWGIGKDTPPHADE
ncbi:hypothetical protein BGZ83_000861 [Gryganskiella cystojenkinii]|nr:hypothetical protein BGZ83_000861 [Gryganskiella cystojenkinii]